MPCIGPVVKPGTKVAACTRSMNKSLHEFKPNSFSDRCPSTPVSSDHSPAVIEVGSSRFIVKSGDRHLIQELRHFCETLMFNPRAEVLFTNKLLSCTEQGRLQPWGWERQPNPSC